MTCRRDLPTRLWRLRGIVMHSGNSWDTDRWIPVAPPPLPTAWHGHPLGELVGYWYELQSEQAGAYCALE